MTDTEVLSQNEVNAPAEAKKTPVEAVKAALEEQKAVFMALLHSKPEYTRYFMLTEQAEKNEHTLEQLKEIDEKSLKSGDTKRALETERKIMEISNEQKVIEEMLSKLNPDDVITREDRQEYIQGLKDATNKAGVNELRAEMREAVKTLRNATDQFEKISDLLYDFRNDLEQYQKYVFSVYYPYSHEIENARLMIEKAVADLCERGE